MLCDIASTLLARSRARRVRVTVVGDILRDQYVLGSAERLCPEAPGVPVLLGGRMIEVPGGAGNAARQLAHWPADVELLGAVDEPTATLLERFGLGRQTDFFQGGRNPIKRRLFSGEQLLLRQDIEWPHSAAEVGEWQALRERVRDRLADQFRQGCDVVLLSDYGKGLFDGPFLRELIGLCRAAGIPVVADPKGHPLDYSGVNVLKPNATWLRSHGGPFPHPGEMAYFRGKGICDALVCSRGPLPPRGFSTAADAEGTVTTPFTCADRHRSVPCRSVIGAGDCTAAHVALALAHGLSVPEAAEVGYSAGRAFVQGEHGRPVLPSEVLGDLDPVGAKILTGPELRQALQARHQGGRVIVANGCFDLLHCGHGWTLQWARQQGDCLVVLVNSDASVARLKGAGRPVVPCEERARQLAALACIDYVTTFAEDTPAMLLEQLRPAALVKGPEWRGLTVKVPGAGLVGEVLTAPPSPWPDHTSDLLERVRR